MKYSVRWTTKNRDQITNQIYTADRISSLLKDLEEWGATDIVVTSIDAEDHGKKAGLGKRTEKTDEYTVELYSESGTWIRQKGVFETYEDAIKFEDEHPIDEDNYYYSIWRIEYDENGEETAAFPVV